MYMYCDNNSNNFQDNCVINETKNCSNFSDYSNINNGCDNNSSFSNSFTFSKYLPIIIVIIIFILFFCNNKSEC